MPTEDLTADVRQNLATRGYFFFKIFLFKPLYQFLLSSTYASNYILEVSILFS